MVAEFGRFSAEIGIFFLEASAESGRFPQLASVSAEFGTSDLLNFRKRRPDIGNL
jgi:hypothetical protein